ncbi:MAG: ANTAR domain-containing protein [Ruminiclostridium sp.]|nr:ANTAR domain-containing protein [Ruminiclostridium sp.]
MKRKILIAAGTEKACEMFREMLGNGVYEITTATEVSEIRAYDLENFSALFFSLPLADESGIKLIDELATDSSPPVNVPVCVIVRQDIPDKALERLTKDNCYVLKRPVSRSNITLAAELLSSFYGRSADMRARISELERKNNEMKLMSRAKLLLIEKKGMSENDAHRHILHRAMNRQMSIDEVCREIIGEIG